MAYQKVRAIAPVNHDNKVRIPGVVTGENAQDFVVSDLQAAALVALGVVTSLGAAQEVTRTLPMSMLVGEGSGRAVGADLRTTAALRNANPMEVTYVALGHSLLDQNDAEGASASNGKYNNVQGVFSWMNVLSGRKYRLLKNAGVANNTTDDMIARYATDVTPYPSKRLLFWGIINDLAQNFSFEKITGNLTTIFDLAFGEGRLMQAVLEHFPAAGKELTASQSRVGMNVQRWMRAQAQIRSNFELVPVFDLVCNATAVPPNTSPLLILDDSGSGFHGNGALMRRVAAWLVARDALLPAPSILPASAYDTYVDTNSKTLLDNGLFLCANPAVPAGTPGAACNVAWAQDQAVTAGLYRINGGRIYQATGAGTTGASAPVHNTGSVSDGGVTWECVHEKLTGYRPFIVGEAVTAGTVRSNAAKVYEAQGNGSTGGTLPVHTSGSLTDGAVVWKYVSAGPVLGVADTWQVKRNTGNGNCVAFVRPAPNGVGNQQVMAIAGETVGSTSATALYEVSPTTNLFGRMVNGGQYTTRARVQVRSLQHIHSVMARWSVVGATSHQCRDLSPEASNTDPLETDVDFEGVFETPYDDGYGTAPATGNFSAGGMAFMVYAPSVPPGTSPYTSVPFSRGIFGFSQAALDRVN